MRRKQWVTIICKQCKESFEVPPSKSSRVFCSAECSRTYGPRRAERLTKICPTCEEPFTVLPHEYDKRIYCSPACSNRRSPNPTITITCLNCGEDYTYIDYGKTHVYCSKKCHLAHKRRKPRQCPQCGKMFDAKRSKKKKGIDQKYCSPRCQGLARRSRVTLECRRCGKSFEVITSKNGRSQYCSRRCQLLHQFHSNAEETVVKHISSILCETPERQHTFPWLVNDQTGRLLHLDAFFPEHDLAVEYDGKQHFQFVPFYHPNKAAFRDLQERDRLKERLLAEHHITLLRVSYREPKTIEHLKDRLASLSPEDVSSL